MWAHKRRSKNPHNLYLPNIPILCKFAKNEFWGHFQNSLSAGPKKFQKLLWAHRPSKPTIDFLEMPREMPTLMAWGICLSLGETWCQLRSNQPIFLNKFYIYSKVSEGHFLKFTWYDIMKLKSQRFRPYFYAHLIRWISDQI